MKTIVLIAMLLASMVATAAVTNERGEILEENEFLNDSSDPIARGGCCSWHGGVCGCNAYGDVVCCDGTTSPSCTCNGPTPERPISFEDPNCDTGLLLARSSTRVRSYTKRSGAYVGSHRRTSPDRSRSNNWSSRGSINPYTGKKGTKKPY